MPIAIGFGNPAEWIIIFVIALIIFGPEKLPEVGKQLGKAMRDFRKMADEITGATQSIHEEITSATGQIRTDVEAGVRPVLNAPVERKYDQPDVDPMAPAKQLETARDPSPGLKLSTAPQLALPEEPDLKG